MTLRIVFYSTGTTPDHQWTEYVSHYSDLTFKTFYPGGLYGSCSFFVPGGIRDPQLISGGKRIEILDGLHTVWEGIIENTIQSVSRTGEGMKIECTGIWGTLMKRKRWDKVWCDTRITQNEWEWGNEQDQFRVERRDNITIFPRDADFAVGDDGRVTLYNAWNSGHSAYYL